MLFVDDIMCYFDEVSRSLREENIPIFNNVIMDYPGFSEKEAFYQINEETDDEGITDEDY